MVARQERSASGFCRSTSGPDGAVARCTTRRGNAHSTEIGEQREVLYPWHPWAGCIVLVHEAVEKLDGTVLRCSREGGSRERWLELPAWMFDRARCLPIRIARDPHVAFAALAELKELLAEAASHCHQILRFRAQQMRLATKTGEILMRHQSQRHATDHGQVRQLDLFGLPTSAGFEQLVPSWRVLPEETRRVVTEMLARLLLDHGRVDRCPIGTEEADDV